MYQKYKRIQIFKFKRYDELSISSFISVFQFHDESIKDINSKIIKAIETLEHDDLINELASLLFYQVLSDVKIDERVTKSKSINQINLTESFKTKERRKLLNKKVFDAEKLEELFSLKINIIELEKHLIQLENSNLIETLNKTHFVSNIIKLFYKYLLIQITNIIFWNEDDSHISKYTYRGVINEFMKLSRQLDENTMTPINRKGAQIFIINFFKSLNEDDYEKGEELINTMFKLSNQINFYNLIWNTVSDSVKFKNTNEKIEINNLLRPFYHYLIKNIKNRTSEFYDSDDSDEKKLFRDFKIKSKNKVKLV